MMRLRNGASGYGAVSISLHWLSVVLLVVQVVVGYTMEPSDALDRADARLDAYAERAEERAERRGEAAEERVEREVERREEALDAREHEPSRLHLVLGLGVLALGLARLLWRRTTPLPPWSERLSARDRVVQSWLERALLTLLLVVPGTGLLLVLGSHDWVWVHVLSHVLLYATVAAHVALVLVRRTTGRMLGLGAG